MTRNQTVTHITLWVNRTVMLLVALLLMGMTGMAIICRRHEA